MLLPQVAIFVKIWLVPVPVAYFQRFAVKPRKMKFSSVNVPIIKFPDLSMRPVLNVVLNSMVLAVMSVLRGTEVQVRDFQINRFSNKSVTYDERMAENDERNSTKKQFFSSDMNISLFIFGLSSFVQCRKKK